MVKPLEKERVSADQDGKIPETTAVENLTNEQKTDAQRAEAPHGAAAQNRQPTVKLDDSKVVACYANFCRVTGTPEELILDFGLNSQPMGVPVGPIPVTQRLVINFFTAKRLLAALQMSLQRHETAFGVLETDVQRRVLPNVFRQQAQGRA